MTVVGGYAEVAVAPAAMVVPVPDGVDLQTAAAFPTILAPMGRVVVFGNATNSPAVPLDCAPALRRTRGAPPPRGARDRGTDPADPNADGNDRKNLRRSLEASTSTSTEPSAPPASRAPWSTRPPT